MPKRVSEDERVVMFFQQAPLPQVEWLLTILKAIVKGRMQGVGGAVTTAAAKPAKKKSVTKKATPVAAQTTSTNMETKDAN